MSVVCVNRCHADPVPAIPPLPADADDVLPADHAVYRSLLKQFGLGFSAHHTLHFTIVTDAGATCVDRVRAEAESTYARVRRFAEKLNLPVVRPKSKLIVLLFDKAGGFRTETLRRGLRVDENVPGLFDQHTNQCLLFDFADSPIIRKKRSELSAPRSRPGADSPRSIRTASEDPVVAEPAEFNQVGRVIDSYEQLITATVVRHEIAHQVLTNLGIQKPHWLSRRWLTEGLAMQFETDSDTNEYRLADLLQAVRTRPISIRVLLADSARLGPGASDLPAAYASAWGLVRFLRDRHGKAFAEFLAIPVAAAEDPRGSGEDAEIRLFEDAFGPLATLQSEFNEYLQRLARPS